MTCRWLITTGRFRPRSRVSLVMMTYNNISPLTNHFPKGDYETHRRERINQLTNDRY